MLWDPCPGATRCLPPSVICRPFRACALTRKGRENSRTSTTTRTSRTRHDIYAQQAHADEKWRRVHFEQRARLCDSWKILRSLPLSPKIGVKRPALSRGAGAAQAPARRKGGIAGHEVPWRPRCASFARFAELAGTAKQPHTISPCVKVGGC